MNRTDRQRTMRGARSMTTEPQTEAGRALLDEVGVSVVAGGSVEEHILAIDPESFAAGRAAALEDVAERVRGLREALQWLVDHSVPTHAQWCFIRGDDEPCICGVSAGYDTVLSLLSTKEEGS